MKKFYFQFLAIVFGLVIHSNANAAGGGGGHYGLDFGIGLPYLSQYGLDYISSSNKWSVQLGYNVLSVTSGLASASLKKPELVLKWHPFSGSFFIGTGFGQQTLESSATDSLTGQTAKVSVTSTTITPTVGWMWGVESGGIFAGVDFGYQSPSGAKTTITSSLAPTNQAYIDANDQATKLGNTAFSTFTLFRFGILF